MKRTIRSRAQSESNAVGWPVLETPTNWAFGKRRATTRAFSLGTDTSRSPLRTSAGAVGKVAPGATAGGAGLGCGQPTQSSPGTWSEPSQPATLNGANVERRRPAAVASYCARRVASGAEVSHGKTPSVQKVAR